MDRDTYGYIEPRCGPVTPWCLPMESQLTKAAPTIRPPVRCGIATKEFGVFFLKLRWWHTMNEIVKFKNQSILQTYRIWLTVISQKKNVLQKTARALNPHTHTPIRTRTGQVSQPFGCCLDIHFFLCCRSFFADALVGVAPQEGRGQTWWQNGCPLRWERVPAPIKK